MLGKEGVTLELLSAEAMLEAEAEAETPPVKAARVRAG